MNPDPIKQILQHADSLAGAPAQPVVDTLAVRRQARANRMALRVGAGICGAAAVAVFCVWPFRPMTQGPGPGRGQDGRRIAQIEAEVRQLQADTDVLLAVIQGLARQREQDQRIATLQAELAGIPDPMEQLRAQVSQAAESMVRDADQLRRRPGQGAAAIRRYSRVIELFPDTEWAIVASQRLAQIRGKNIEGDRI